MPDPLTLLLLSAAIFLLPTSKVRGFAVPRAGEFMADSNPVDLQDSDISTVPAQETPVSMYTSSMDLSMPSPLVNVDRVDINSVNQAVHSLILGETNSGKSTLATYLAKQLKGQILIIDPHATPTDWQGLQVIGLGRDYRAIADCMASLLKMMDDRYEERGKGKTDFDELVIICDEFPAIAASKEAGKISKVWLKDLAREARKVKMKLLILTQGSEVKSLGIEGEGSLRACFCFVRLGGLAIEHARKLKDDVLLAEVKKLKRPCMVDDAVAVLPEIGAC